MSFSNTKGSSPFQKKKLHFTVFWKVCFHYSPRGSIALKITTITAPVLFREENFHLTRWPVESIQLSTSQHHERQLTLISTGLLSAAHWVVCVTLPNGLQRCDLYCQIIYYVSFLLCFSLKATFAEYPLYASFAGPMTLTLKQKRKKKKGDLITVQSTAIPQCEIEFSNK